MVIYVLQLVQLSIYCPTTPFGALLGSINYFPLWGNLTKAYVDKQGLFTNYQFKTMSNPHFATDAYVGFDLLRLPLFREFNIRVRISNLHYSPEGGGRTIH